MKLLALDLDGTILTTDKQVTPRTREALTAAIRSGVEVVLVTGRPYLGLPDELLQIPGIRYAITSNGAVSTDLSNGQNLRASLLPPDIVQEIVKIPRKRDLIYNVFIDGAGYSEPHIYQRQLQPMLLRE